MLLLLGRGATVPSIHAKFQAHIADLGVGYMPLHLIRDEIAAGQLIIKKVEKAKPTAHFSVAWRPNQAGKATQWFLNKLEDFKI